MYKILLFLVFPATFLRFGLAAQIDAVVLDELLREIVDSSMSNLRHRLQEAVFATSFRRKILENSDLSSASKSSEYTPKYTSSNLESLIDDYTKPQKLSLSLETFTQPTTSTTVAPVLLVTADDVTIAKSGKLFRDDITSATSSSIIPPRVPVYVAVIVGATSFCMFLLLIGSIVYFCTTRRKEKKMNIFSHGAPLDIIPDPLSVDGLSTCHIAPRRNLPGSRSSSIYLDHRDRATSSLWTYP